MAPDQNVDAAKFHAEEIRRAMQRDECAETKMLTRVRLILRRVLGRQNPWREQERYGTAEVRLCPCAGDGG